jgi:hypothetical protein
MLAGLALGAVAARDRATRRLAMLGLAWLGLAWIFGRSMVRPYAHYFIATTPPLALLIGAGVASMAGRAPADRLMFPWDMSHRARRGRRAARAPPASRAGDHPGGSRRALSRRERHGELEVVERLPDDQGGELVIMSRRGTGSPLALTKCSAAVTSRPSAGTAP